ncbi:MAG: sigma 54-interacting transcriptional regulator [Deltaproteobacteria bacterium]|nr:sigma 54-interacting transcriptional regulator [Deltaproteobacteria bacterium]
MALDKKDARATEATELRRHAENKLNTATAIPGSRKTNEEMQRIVHELEVHQIELEMQNEELRRTQDRFELALKRYQNLYDFAPVGYVTLDAHGLIQEVNSACVRLLGLDRRFLVKKQFASLINDADGKKLFLNHMKNVLQGQGVQRCEIRLNGRDGVVIQTDLQSTVAATTMNSTSDILTAIIDGTVQKKIEEELLSRNESLELIVQGRTKDLALSNVQLSKEIGKYENTQQALRTALVEIERLKDRLQAENLYLQKEVAREYNFGEIIGQSSAIAHVLFRIEQAAPLDVTVLLLGETGTGKGVVARAIHGRSARKNRPMITVNCTALPANLIESELFGREKGAFTGASARQMGRFELADGGTIFLDEIGEMPLELQVKLLRVIQDGEFERLGSPHTIKVNVRIIAASNRNLAEEISKGRFREDLFYRLNTFPITIPPLRRRDEDIPLLVNHFLAKFNKKMGRTIETVPRATLTALRDYHWPGNVRELESVIERAVILSQGTTLEVLDRLDPVRTPAESVGQDVKALAELERDHIVQVLQKTGWRIEGKKGAAVLLGLNPSTLRARMRKYGIHR